MNRFRSLPQANLRPLRNHRNIPHVKRRAVLGEKDRLSNVLRPVDQSHFAHIDLLQTLLDKTSARVGIVICELLFDLRQAEPVCNQFVRIDPYLIFARRPSETGNIHHVRHGLETLFNHPIFHRLQFHRVIGRVCAVQREKINLTHRTPVRPHLRDHARRQRDLAQPLQHPFPIPVVLGFVVEDQFQVGESEQRERSQVNHVRNAAHHDLERNRHLLFDLLRRNSRPLRNHFNVVVRHIGISFNGKVAERSNTPGKKHQSQSQHQQTVAQSEVDDSANHLLLHRVLQLQSIRHHLISRLQS